MYTHQNGEGNASCCPDRLGVESSRAVSAEPYSDIQTRNLCTPTRTVREMQVAGKGTDPVHDRSNTPSSATINADKRKAVHGDLGTQKE